MQEVTCFQCHSRVRLTPDVDHCTVCGEDLRGLLESKAISRYFGDRAVEMAAAGALESALAEVKRGLTYADLADLRLLGAILAEQLGRYDVMRAHVAAIPVDDSLRSEAEWLLRAHQNRQAALREDLKRDPRSSSAAPSSTVLADVLGMPAQARRTSPQPARRPLWAWSAVAAVLLAMLALSGWFLVDRGADYLAGLFARPQPASPAQQAEAGPPPAAQPDAVATAAAAARAAAILTSTVPTTPTSALPTPTASVPLDLVLQVTETPALADSNPGGAMMAAAAGFDLRKLLQKAGRPDLAELPIEARVQDGKLTLQGIVFMDVQRRDLLALVEQAPGIQAVNAVDLLLRPKATYIVQEGDTLWSIVYDIYGNVDRLQEFAAANLDVAPQPGLLRAGDELKVPPLE